MAVRRTTTRTNGYFGYSDEMLVTFIIIIYNLVSDVQVRLGLAQMGGLTRIVALWCSRATSR